MSNDWVWTVGKSQGIFQRVTVTGAIPTSLVGEGALIGLIKRVFISPNQIFQLSSSDLPVIVKYVGNSLIPDAV